MKNVGNFYVPSITFSNGFPYLRNDPPKENEMEVSMKNADKETTALLVQFPILMYKLKEEILSICSELEDFSFPVYQGWKNRYKESITQYIMSEAKFPAFQITGESIHQVTGEYLSGILTESLQTNDFFRLSDSGNSVSPFSLNAGASGIQANGIHLFAKRVSANEIFTNKDIYTPFVIIHDDISRPSLSLVSSVNVPEKVKASAAAYGFIETVISTDVAMELQDGLSQISNYCLNKIFRQITNIREATNNNYFDFAQLLKIVLSYLDGPDNIGYVFTKDQVLPRTSTSF